MARASVELIVEAAKAVNPLRKVEQHSKKVDQALKRSQKAARDVEAAFQRMGRTGIRSFRDLEVNAARLGKRMGGLRAAAAKVAVGLIAFKAGQAAIGRIESVRRLNRLGGAYGEVADLQNAATKAAETFGLSQTEANQQFSQIYARLRPVGVTLKDIESTFVGFNTVARLSGASSVEASNAFTQLAQALGSGALRGDEFNSISEQVPGILTAISQETGVAQGNLRKFAAEGKITSDIVMRALKRIEKEGAGGLKDAMSGPAQAFKDFKNIADNALVALGEESIPQVIRLIKQLGGVIEGLMPVIKAVGGFAATVLGGIADIIDRIRDPGKLQAEAQAFFDKGQGKRPMANLPADLKQTEAPFFATPAATVSSVAGGAGDADGTGKKRVDMTQGLLELNNKLREQQEAGNEREVATLELMIRRQEIAESSLLPVERENQLQEALFNFRRDIFDLDKRIAEQAEQREKAQEDTLRPLEEQKKILEGKLAGNEKEVRLQLQVDKIMRSVEGLSRKDVENKLRANDTLEQQVKQAEELKAFYQGVADTIQSGIVDGIMSAIDGSKSLQESLSGILKSVGRMFLNQAIGSVMPTFDAEGGYHSGATNAVVGEAGPEYVIPESKMRESMARYARGARGSAVIPENGEGGTSSEGGGVSASTLDVRFNVERINSVDYVTASEFQAGMRQAAAQGAQRGQQAALKRLQQSPSTRRRVGI